MSDFASRLKEIRTAKGLTQAELAEKTGLSQAAIGLWEVGKRSPTFSSVKALAAALGVSVEDLAEDSTSTLPPPKRGRPRKNLPLIDTQRHPWETEIRVYGKVPCGPPEPSPEGGVQPLYLIDVGKSFGDTSNLFGVIAHGGSMATAKIDDGDLVIIRADTNPDVGERVLACIRERDYTVKKLVTRDGQRVLESCDGRRSRIPVDENVTFIGRVVGSMRGYVEPETDGSEDAES